LGGGFPVPRDPFGKKIHRTEQVLLYPLAYVLMNASRILGKERRYRFLKRLFPVLTTTQKFYSSPPVGAYAKVICESLERQFREEGIEPDGMTLQLEPGRALYGNTGVHLARVIKLKKQTRPLSFYWALVDTSTFFLKAEELDRASHNFIVANKAEEKEVTPYEVVGSTCAADRIYGQVYMPPLEKGDILAILDMGAYQEVSAANFNALPRPAMVLVNGQEVELIKRRETIEDVFRRDQVPERLLVSP
jgi:diaminopimelate decarboxylase